jgi:L-prolyl-PCP dehydrogenase
MNFSWTPEQISFRDSIISFVKSELQDDLVERDSKGIFARDLWMKCADFGIQGLAAPKKYGGKNETVDLITAVLAMEAFGYACPDNGLALGLNAHMWTVLTPIVQFGNEDQKKKFIPKMVSGEWIAAHALTEPNTGSDVFSMEMTAEKRDGGYILNGKKHLITFAPIADMVLVFANANPNLGKWGVTAFLVEKGTPGFSVSPVRDKMGLRTVPIGELNFDDCFVPEENRLGGEGAGFSLVNHSLEYDRCCILASHLGAMERQLEQTIAYVKTRKQFGQAIGKFQSVSNRIADMKLRLETSRLLLYKAVWEKQSGKSAMLDVALLKLQLSESFVSSSLDAMRCYGGRAYLTDTGVERDLRDAVGGLLYAGTSDIQRNIIAKLLGV